MELDNDTSNTFNGSIRHANGSFITEFHIRLFKTTLGFCILLVIGIIIVNSLLLMTIFTTSTLKRELRYWLMSSMSVGDLLIGLAGIPFYIDFLVQSKVTVSCTMHVFLQVLMLYSHVMTTSVGLVILNVEYILKQYNYRPPQLNQNFQWFLNILFALLPWISVPIVISPLVVYGLHEVLDNLWTSTWCPLLLYKWAVVSLNVLTFYLPVFVLVLTSSLIIYGMFARSRGNLAFRPSLLNEEKTLPHPKYLLINNALCFFLLLPEHVVRTGVRFGEFWVLLLCYTIFFLLEMAKGIAIPATWLCIPEVNQALKERCQISFWRKTSNAPRHVINKTYREFEKEDVTE